MIRPPSGFTSVLSKVGRSRATTSPFTAATHANSATRIPSTNGCASRLANKWGSLIRAAIAEGRLASDKLGDFNCRNLTAVAAVLPEPAHQWG
jgi:hypothetical protein